MKLNQSIAERMVERFSDGVHGTISVVNPSATVLASTNPAFVGTCMPPLDSAAATGISAESISLPIAYMNHVIGGIVIHTLRQHGEELAYVVKSLAELIVHQAAITEQLAHQQAMLDAFVSDLLHGRLQESTREPLHEAALLNIDLAIPRTVILFSIEPLALTRTTPTAQYDDPQRTTSAQPHQLHASLIQQIRSVLPPNEAHIYSFMDEHHLVGLMASDLDDLRTPCQLMQHVQRCIDVAYR